MDQQIKQALFQIIHLYSEKGPQWKPGKDLAHLKKRISRRDVPIDFTLEEYNNLIVEILNNVESDIHIYRLNNFHQGYFAFSRNHWIIIIGEDEIIETAMKTSSTERYLSEEKGYIYVGTVKEVIS